MSPSSPTQFFPAGPAPGPAGQPAHEPNTAGSRPASRLRVVHLQRRPTTGHFSVESHFEEVRTLLAPRFDIDVEVMPQLSRGVVPRIQNVLYARQHQGDISHIVGDSHYLATLLDPGRTILTVLDCVMVQQTRGLRRALLKLFWFTIPSRRVAAITVISEATRREVLQQINFPAERIHVIPVFISGAFQYTPQAFNSELPVILQIGTRHNKNLERLILALQGIPCRLVIVGILTEHQRQLLAETHVQFENHEALPAPDLVTLYQRCDLLTFASTYEGFGMPILEAQTVGRPVITSRSSSMPEVAGDGAVLVDPLSVSELRAAVRRVITDVSLRSDLVARGQVNARRYAPARIAEQYAQVYESLTQPGSLP